MREGEVEMGGKHGITHRKNFLQRQERRGRDFGLKVTKIWKSGRRTERQYAETAINLPPDCLVGGSQWERLVKQLKCAIRERVKSQG